MELVLASNFDPALVEQTRDLPISTFFGNFPTSLIGGGRPPRILPAIDPDGFRRHLAEVHRTGRKFYATLNSSDLGLREYSADFSPQFRREVDRLIDLGVDGFVVAVPALLEGLHRDYPDVGLSVSTFARIRTVAQAEYFLRLGADTVVIEEANRDFPLLRGLVRAGARVELLVNQTCLHDCPFRFHHLNTSSLASQRDTANPPWFELPLLECGLELVRDPGQLVSGIFVRPEDLEVYEEIGVHRFKISGRNATTPWLVRVARAYAARRYDGNLLDILSYVQNRAPRAALRQLAERGVAPKIVGPLADAFDALASLEIDNGAFPAGFLRRVAATDCLHTSCAACGYCATVARKVVRIRGRPLAEYEPPASLPDPRPLWPSFGAGEGAGRSTNARPTPPVRG